MTDHENYSICIETLVTTVTAVIMLSHYENDLEHFHDNSDDTQTLHKPCEPIQSIISIADRQASNHSHHARESFIDMTCPKRWLIDSKCVGMANIDVSTPIPKATYITAVNTKSR